MAENTWTLTDTATGLYVDELTISPNDVEGGAEGYEVTKKTLRGGLSDGVDIVQVKSGDLSFAVLPTRGMGLWKAWLAGQEIGWQSPVRGPVNPAFVPLMEPGGLGWLDGFDELLVRCGLESNGAPDFNENGRLAYPLHGRIANRPAHHVEVSVDGELGEVSVTGVVEETRFHFSKLRLTSTVTTKVGEASLRIRDVIENFSGSSAEIQMLYHTNFGQPLLDPVSVFVAPVKTVVPRNERAAEGIETWNAYAPEVAGYAEQVYFLELLTGEDGMTHTLLKNAEGTRGVSILLNKNQLPCYTLWKNTTASADGYVTGLEPGTNFPNPRTFEGQQGRVVRLAPGATTAFDLVLAFHKDSDEVKQAEDAIAAIQGDAEPEIGDEPWEGWCAS